MKNTILKVSSLLLVILVISSFTYKTAYNIATTNFFNKLVPIVIPNSSVVSQGGVYSSKVVLAAIDTVHNHKIEIGDVSNQDELKITNGVLLPYNNIHHMAEYSIKASTLGNHRYEGLITCNNLSGNEEKIPFSSSYTVVQHNITCTPTKMNILYTGVDNPIDISVPGVKNENIFITILPAGSAMVVRSSYVGSYLVRPKKNGRVRLQLNTRINGETKVVGFKEFRCKSFPLPEAKFAGEIGGEISKQKFISSKQIEATVPDFDFQTNFRIVSFSCTIINNGKVEVFKLQGQRINSELRSRFIRLSSNDKIYFEDIKVKDATGRIRTLHSMSFKISS